MSRAAAVVLAALLAPASLAAQTQAEPRFCPNRPDLGATGCTTAPGELQAEVSALDWTADTDDEGREDRIGFGDVLARFGLDARTELQAQWTPFVTVRQRERGTGSASTHRGVGDVRLAVRRNVSHPDGEALSTALEPFVVLPIARHAVGDGDWSAGVVVPVSYDLGGGWSAGFTGQLSAQADEDGHGRHFDANGVVGLGRELTQRLSATAELYLERDDDPAGAATQLLAAGSAAWKLGERSQIDVLGVAGLNHDSPDVRIVLGGALLF